MNKYTPKLSVVPADTMSLSRRAFVNRSLQSSLAVAAMLSLPACSGKRETWRYRSHFEEYSKYDAVGLARLVKRGDADPLELLEIAIARAEHLNPQFNFMATPLYEYARAQLKAATPTGSMAGVPFLLKDLSIDLKDTRLTYGSVLFKDHISKHDSTLAVRYKKAGLVIFGKTTSPEFGKSITTESRLFGPSLNPWDKTRSPGGSSGGSAAAVALGVLPAAHASDGGGSIRIPASACGLFGLKPSRGRTPYGPQTMESSGGLSIMHVISRSVRDSAALLDASRGPEVGSRYTVPPPKIPYLAEVKRSPGKLKIGVLTGEGAGIPIDKDCTTALEQARELCKDLGHKVETIAWPKDINRKSTGDVMGVLMGSNLVVTIEDAEKRLGRPVTQEEIEAVNWWQNQHMRDISAAQYVRAERGLSAISLAMARTFGDCDMVLSPTMAALPPLIGTVDASQNVELVSDLLFPYAIFTAIYNITGQPAMTVPLYWNSNNVPVGVMFGARSYSEHTLFRLAGQLEKAVPWENRRPMVG